jgi:hypothetical protein
MRYFQLVMLQIEWICDNVKDIIVIVYTNISGWQAKNSGLHFMDVFRATTALAGIATCRGELSYPFFGAVQFSNCVIARRPAKRVDEAIAG